MVRNCSIAIIVWILLVAGYGYYLWPQVRDEARWIVPLVMGSVVWGGLASIHGTRYALRDWRARNRLARGERPQDGDLVSAIGAIRPVFEPLRAPFTGRECVLYSYEIGPPPSGQGRVAKDYAGFGMVPCEVQTPYGAFRLGTFPILENLADDRGDRTLGDEYVQATTFEELSIATVAKRIFAIHTQPPPLRIDWRIGQPSHVGLQYVEQILAPGQTITAIGRYISANNSIVSDTKDKGYLRVRPGGDPRRVSSFPSEALGKLFGGLAIVVVANVVMWLLLRITPR